MQDITLWKEKIKEKVRATLRRDFVQHITSWYPLVLTKNAWYISSYPPTPRIAGIIPYKEYEAGRDDLVHQWLDYDFEQDFFHNIQRLRDQTKLPNLLQFADNENSDYAYCVLGSKNVYMGFTIIKDVENCLYSFSVKTGSRNIFNSVMVRDNSENIYMSSGIITGYAIFYSRYMTNCSNMRFCSNCFGCQECLFCHDLNNQSYCIANKVYEREIYFQKKQELLAQKEKYLQWYQELPLSWANPGSTDVEGHFIINSQGIRQGNYVSQIDQGKNLILIGGETKGEEVYDCFLNTPPISDMYGVVSAGTGSDNIYNSLHIVTGTNIYYSVMMDNCSYCLGCMGLKNKSFCILNKQYSQEERYEVANKIFAQMEKDWTLWTFFPWWMNPFYFNDTAAYLLDDTFTKDELLQENYLWRDEEIKVDIPAGAEVVKSKELDTYQWYNEKWAREINPEILKKVIIDEKGNSYRIVKMEYDFLMKHGLPLPEIHRLERIKLWFKFK